VPSDRTIAVLFIEQDREVWRPDAYRSVRFLVASALALAVFGRTW
jgi:hypothetical protein